MYKIIILLLSFLTLFIFQGCGDKEEIALEKSSQASFPDSLRITERPSNPLSVVEARQRAKKGDTLTLVGVIGGRPTPFVENRAAFILADEHNITACSKREGDNCQTPWDYCCETPDKIKESTVMIQVVGKNNKVLKESLKGFGGLKELSKVIIQGVFDDNTTEENVIINAVGIYINSNGTL